MITAKKRNRFLRIGIAYWTLVRGLNLVVLAFTMGMVRSMIVTPSLQKESFYLPEPSFWFLTFATIFTAAAGYIINDYYDVKIDLINKPGRVVLGRIIHRRLAIILHFTFNFLALFLAFWVDWKLSLMVAGVQVVLWYYANRLKRIALIGNTTIAILTGWTIYQWVWLYPSAADYLLLYALFAFILSLIREIIKDMEDIRGDQQHGCKTLPIEIGIRNTKYVLFGLLIGFGWYLIKAFFTLQPALIWYFILVLGPALLFWTYGLWKAETASDFGRLSAFSKVMMVMGVWSMVLL
ncbi:MAG: geranylgeranylglycerol-phosphate geranylgeranyltransferase [Cytophagaceae bacterium]|jgi:4-hydroxybenzoate polyprenyltransferase|nr:geranylgeranylglycerol-phosphate geranylgeranyltransferase [Cytophagaceae bacterium]